MTSAAVTLEREAVREHEALAVRTRRHIMRRFVPFLFVLYVLNYLDRVNISYASLRMTDELGFSNAVFGFGAGLFSSATFSSKYPPRSSSRHGTLGILLARVCWCGARWRR